MSGMVAGGAMMTLSALSSFCCAAQCLGSMCCSLASCFGCSDRSPALAKLVYLLIFLSSATLAVFMRFYGQPALSSWVPQITSVCNGSIASCFGVQAVYRISFALAAFFALMALFVFIAPVTHRGGWLIKLIIYVVILGLTLLIPNANMVTYAEAARVFSVFFLLSQVLIIINLVFVTHETLTRKKDEVEERAAESNRHTGLLGNCWGVLYVALCLFFLVGSVVSAGVMYSIFGNNCPLNNFFISQTLVIGLTLCVLSVTFPGTFGKGLLPPAAILAYNTYLTYSAITNNPDSNCNPTVRSNNQNQASIIAGLVIAVISVTYTALSSAGTLYSAVSTSASTTTTTTEEKVTNPSHTLRGGDGSYQGEGVAKDEEEGWRARNVGSALPPTAPTTKALRGEEEDEEEGGGRGGGRKVERQLKPGEEKIESRWEAASFHVELFLAGCYVGMMASNWGDPSQQNSANAPPELSLASMWARMGTQFCIHILFTWTLIAPILCPGRDFS